MVKVKRKPTNTTKTCRNILGLIQVYIYSTSIHNTCGGTDKCNVYGSLLFSWCLNTLLSQTVLEDKKNKSLVKVKLGNDFNSNDAIRLLIYTINTYTFSRAFRTPTLSPSDHLFALWPHAESKLQEYFLHLSPPPTLPLKKTTNPSK